MTGFVFSDAAMKAVGTACAHEFALNYNDEFYRADYWNGIARRLLAAAVAVDAHRIEQETREKIAREVEAMTDKTGCSCGGPTDDALVIAARIRAGEDR